MSISRVAVVGAGLLGLAAAREVTERFPDADITVFDKADALAAHQSGHTSGIVDAGLEQIPGSPAADLARRGVQLLVPYMAERGVPYRECGQLFVAQNTDEAERLEELFARAEDNGIPGVRLLERSEIRAVEPAARGVLGLFAPHAAVADFAALTEALAADVRAAGGDIRLSTEVTGFDVMSNEIRLRGRPVASAGQDDQRAAEGSGRAADSAGAADEAAVADGMVGAGADTDPDAGRPAHDTAGTSDDTRTSGDGDAPDDADIDDQVHDRPRTYRGDETREPVIGIGDELRDRFGDQDWFRQAESTVSEWADRLTSSWSRGAGTRRPGDPDDRSGVDSNRWGTDDHAGTDRRPRGGTDPGDRDAVRDHADRNRAEEVLGTFDIVIVCAGLQADRIAALAGLDEQPRIVPFACDYYTAGTAGTGTSGTDPGGTEAAGAQAVRGIIGSVPDPAAPFAETSIVRGLDDRLILGPNTFVALGREAYGRRGFDLGDIGAVARSKGFWKFAAQTAKTAAKGVKSVVSKSAFVDGVRRLVPDLDAETVSVGTRGVRAQAMNDDGGLIDDLTTNRRGRLTVVRAVPKWGATSALAIAESIVDRAVEKTAR